MRLGKELLLSFIAMMHIAFVASGTIQIQELRVNMQGLALPLCNLDQAEKDYVKYIFKADPPEEYKSNRFNLTEGITSPVGNTTKEIQNSLCCITDYLKHRLPYIIRSLEPKHGDELVGNTTAFCSQFEQVVEMTSSGNQVAPKRCHRNERHCLAKTLDIFEMKVFGLRIIYSIRTWVEEFANIETSCNNVP